MNLSSSDDNNSDETISRVTKLNYNLAEINLETELQNKNLKKNNLNYKNVLKIVKSNINELKEVKDKDFSIIIWMIGFSLLFILLIYFILL